MFCFTWMAHEFYTVTGNLPTSNRSYILCQGQLMEPKIIPLHPEYEMFHCNLSSQHHVGSKNK